MKRLSITAIILSAILLALFSCAKNGEEGAETNTAEPSHSTFPGSGFLRQVFDNYCAIHIGLHNFSNVQAVFALSLRIIS
jgi:hypothetical protein